jgi:hypothetical protein
MFDLYAQLISIGVPNALCTCDSAFYIGFREIVKYVKFDRIWTLLFEIG